MAKKKAAKKTSAPRVPRRQLSPETVFNHLRLNAVRLISVDANLFIRDGKAPVEAQIKAMPSAGATPDGKRINANVMIEVVGKPAGETSDDCSTVKINAHYQCVYNVENAAIEDITPHGVVIANTAMLVAWPYLRELCSSLTTRMAIPPITLPMYKAPGQSADGSSSEEKPQTSRKSKKRTP